MQYEQETKAYNYMKSRILEGTYVAGQRIVINQLVKELETSAIPIREAVRQLEAEGLIEYQNNIGPVVTPIDDSQYIETLSVLAVLEGYATALSKDFMDKDKLIQLEKLTTKWNKHLKSLILPNLGMRTVSFMMKFTKAAPIYI